MDFLEETAHNHLIISPQCNDWITPQPLDHSPQYDKNCDPSLTESNRPKYQRRIGNYTLTNFFQIRILITVWYVQGLHLVQPPPNQGIHLVQAPPNQGLHLIQPPTNQGLHLIQPPTNQGLHLIQTPPNQSIHLIQPPHNQGIHLGQPNYSQPVQRKQTEVQKVFFVVVKCNLFFYSL